MERASWGTIESQAQALEERLGHVLMVDQGGERGAGELAAREGETSKLVLGRQMLKWADSGWLKNTDPPCCQRPSFDGLHSPLK